MSAKLYGYISGETANVAAITNKRFSVVDFEPSYLTFNKTTISFEMQTTSNTGVRDAYTRINDNENYYYSSERAVFSRTNEIASLGGGPSNNVRISMYSTTDFLSPVIDVGRTHTVFVDNIVNANTYQEDATGLTLTLSGNTGNIVATDVLIGANSGANVTVLSVSGNTFTVSVPGTASFEVGERATVYYANVVAKGSNVTTLLASTYDNKKIGGMLINKYISIPITLAEGQDAEDLLVLLTSYRPPGTEVHVWAKVLHAEDGDSFSYLPWIELEKADGSPYSSLSNRNDFLEYTYRFPVAQRTGPNYEVQYKNSLGYTFTGFKYYAIKIGLSATDSAIIPRVGDLRTIAIQI